MINVKNVIQQGEDAKYNIRIDRQGFSMTENPFYVTLKWGLEGRQLVIQKSEMQTDDNDRMVFTFPTKDMIGIVTDECTYQVPDIDYADGYRTEKEQQPLCFIYTGSRLPQMMKYDDGLYNGVYVSYERRLTSNIQVLYETLRDAVGNILRDVNGKIMRALRERPKNV